MNTLRIASIVAVATLALAGCKKTADNTMNYKSAINSYYAASPACLWADPVKFPVQANTSDTTKTSGYDALVDQGLLTRTTAEKKELLILSRQVTNYDLSDKGRSAWTADATQPGFGNFCYGTRSVQSIDAATPTTDQPGAVTTVNYHVGLASPPAWAAAAETQNAFPQVKTDLTAPVAAVATLTNTTGGWSVTSGPARRHVGATSADGKVVE